MNKFTLLLSTAALSSALAVTPANANAMSSYMENALIDVCKAAQSNNTIRFGKAVDSYRLKTETVALKVVCNGENIADFAATHGAYKTADRLNDALGDVSIEDVADNKTQRYYVNF
ncbi:DUF3718 domain-containing protein [Thalassotalea ponticola]|uniref:DUF3718 domain-containing protein n=1 Tax=Thalassotalea ponticola TaxID=1523392 RepID=UPI0025B5DD2D|nr:DUF3718 domain-containing protein [Thalassotalea ponticola]MDN3653110.1 DUF3718 domain-containing protein [Thalassotalea ponticola]